MTLFDKKPSNSPEAPGFTILELLLAMTVFSFILVAVATGLIQIGRMYYRSVITTRTQNNTRFVVDEISRALQFSGSNITLAGEDDNDTRALCIGGNRYTYKINQQLGSDSDFVLWRDRSGSGSCTPIGDDSIDDNGGIELVSEHMRITRLDIEPRGNRQYVIRLAMAYGDDDLLEGVDANGDMVDFDDASAERVICKPGVPGVQFCAISEVSTVVTRRLE